MTHTCRQCHEPYPYDFKVGNSEDGATRTLCSTACYQAWLQERQTKRERQDHGGPIGLVGIFLNKLLDRSSDD